MVLEEFFNANKVLDLSFFNFENSITAAYFADADYSVRRVNQNFKQFFPSLSDPQGVYFPKVLQALNVEPRFIEEFIYKIENEGRVLIPRLEIFNGDERRVFSLLSTRTTSSNFSFLQGIQGQFVDRTSEDQLRQDKELLLEEQLKNQDIIKQKSERLEEISKRLASYLSPQVFDSIFSSDTTVSKKHQRKNLTVFFSDIVSFTDLSDTLEPELLATLINNYLSEMTNIAIEYGGTIDKFIGDAVMVFFGDPESKGEKEDALACVQMAAGMQIRIGELQSYWKKIGIKKPMQVRMGVSTGYCTVGDFGSPQRLDYTAFGSAVNLAARLQTLAPAGKILISEATQALVEDSIESTKHQTITPKGFARPVDTFILENHTVKSRRGENAKYQKLGNRVSIDIFDTSDIRAAIKELKSIELEFERLANLADDKS
ncbi:MAG: adenylate/guanylate cyclase domain-containing protein [Paracoccaceae bacterium]